VGKYLKFDFCDSFDFFFDISELKSTNFEFKKFRKSKRNKKRQNNQKHHRNHRIQKNFIAIVSRLMDILNNRD
jgi:hypothetical protein